MIVVSWVPAVIPKLAVTLTQLIFGWNSENINSEKGT